MGSKHRAQVLLAALLTSQVGSSEPALFAKAVVYSAGRLTPTQSGAVGGSVGVGEASARAEAFACASGRLTPSAIASP